MLRSARLASRAAASFLPKVARLFETWLPGGQLMQKAMRTLRKRAGACRHLLLNADRG